MRPTNTRRWAGFFVVTLMILGLTAIGRDARAQDRETSSDVPWLGVVTQELTPELKESMEIEGEGVLVSRVVDGSPADRAGIEKGDVIGSVNSRSVGSPDELAQVIRDGRIGQEVRIEVFRNGRGRTLTATLAELPQSIDETPVPGPVRDRDQMEQDKDKNESGQDEERSDRDQERTRQFQFDMPNMERMPMVMGRGRLGVRVQDLSARQRDRDRVDHGALVSEVVDGSAAEKAGLRAGDIITRVDDQSVDGPADLIRAVRAAGDHATITYVRRGATRTAEVELGPASGPDAQRFRMNREDLTPGPEGDRRVIVRRNLSDDDVQSLRQEIRELRRQLAELRRQVEELQQRR